MTWADTEDFHTLSERSHTEKATGSTKSLEQAGPRRQNDASTAEDWGAGWWPGSDCLCGRGSSGGMETSWNCTEVVGAP